MFGGGLDAWCNNDSRHVPAIFVRVSICIVGLSQDALYNFEHMSMAAKVRT